MNALLIKYAAILIGIVALGAGSAVFGWHWRGIKDDDAAEKVAAAQTAVVMAQEAKINALQTQQEAALQAVQQDYENRLQTANASAAALDTLVHNYENRLRASAVPSVPKAAGGIAATSQGTGGNAGVDAGINTAIDSAIGACESDSAQLASLIEWVQKVAQ